MDVVYLMLCLEYLYCLYYHSMGNAQFPHVCVDKTHWTPDFHHLTPCIGNIHETHTVHCVDGRDLNARIDLDPQRLEKERRRQKSW